MNMEYWWGIFISIVIVIFLLFTPFILYFFRLFWRWRHLDIIAKRRPHLVLTFSIITLINTCFIRTYFAILSNLDYSGYDVDALNDPRIRTPGTLFYCI